MDWLSGSKNQPSYNIEMSDGFEDLSRVPEAQIVEVEPERPVRRRDSIRNLLSGLGTRIDKGSAGRPDVADIDLTDEELEVLFRKNGIARKIVRSVPVRGISAGWWWSKYDFKDADKTLKARSKFMEASINAARDGGATVLMVTNDKDLSAPLTNPKFIKCLHVFEKNECRPIEWEGDANEERYGKPTMWRLTPMSPAATTYYGEAEIHWSRILYFDGQEVSKRTRMARGGFGDSILQSCWQSLRGRDTISRSGASMAADWRIDILKITGLGEKTLSDKRGHFLSRMDVIARIRSVLSMTMISDNEEYTSRQTSLTGWDALSKHSAEDIAGESEIPLTQLFGLAPGGLNADGASQEKMMATLVHCWQVDRLQPVLEQYYAVLAQTLGVADYGVLEFMPIARESRKETAEAYKLEAEADSKYVEAGVLEASHVTKSRFGTDSDGEEIIKMTDQEIDAFVQANEEKVQQMADQAVAEAQYAEDPQAGS